MGFQKLGVLLGGPLKKECSLLECIGSPISYVEITICFYVEPVKWDVSVVCEAESMNIRNYYGGMRGGLPSS